jgi:hypothetical protein
LIANRAHLLEHVALLTGQRDLLVGIRDILMGERALLIGKRALLIDGLVGRHVTHMNELCLHMNEPCHTNKSVILHS